MSHFPDEDCPERSVVGSILLDPSVLPSVRRHIGADDFALRDCRIVFEAACRLEDTGQPSDCVLIGVAVNDAGQWEALGDGYGFFSDTMDFVPSAARAEHYAIAVKRNAVRREQVRLGEELKRTAADRSTPSAESIARVSKQMARLESRLADAVDAGIGDLCEAEAAAIERGELFNAWSTGIPPLDALTGGLMEAKLWVVGGKSRHCKTGLATTFTNAALEEGHGVLHVRYEETETDVIRRLVSQRTGIAWSAAQLRNLSPADKAAFASAVRGFAHDFSHKLHFLHDAGLPNIEHALTAHKPKLVVVDTLQAMAHRTAHKRSSDRHDLHVGGLMAWMSSAALRHHCCIVVVSQIGRGSRDGRPKFSHLRESGDIGEKADVVALAWWPHIDDYDKDIDRYVITVAKNRQGGRLANIALAIDPETQVMTELNRIEHNRFLTSAGIAC